MLLNGKQEFNRHCLDLAMGLGVAGGGIVLGKFKAEGGNALYVSLNESEHSLQTRLRKILPSPALPPDNFEYATNWPEMSDGGLDGLEEWLASRPHPRLVIIDSLALPPAKQAVSHIELDEEHEAFAGLRKLANRYHVCVLVPCDSDPNGPGFEPGAQSTVPTYADGVLHLKQVSGSTGYMLFGTGNAYPQNLALPLAFRGGSWKVVRQAPPQNVESLSKARREVLDVLHAQGRPMKSKEIALALGKLDSTVRRMLYTMKANGQVKETEQGFVALALVNAGRSSKQREYTIKKIVNVQEPRYAQTVSAYRKPVPASKRSEDHTYELQTQYTI
jgi:hypothetical protein